jgi:[protein-PII] uridylyltransferase
LGDALPAGIKAHKALIQANTAELAERFRAGAPIAGLIRARADFIDRLLAAAWHRLAGPYADTLTLAAVGGYGRRELHPYSDIDILLLLDDPPQADGCAWEQPYEQALSAFYHFLLDVGLSVGHSVRTVDDCVQAARDDQTVMTNLMEARFLAGSRPLFDALMLRLSP